MNEKQVIDEVMAHEVKALFISLDKADRKLLNDAVDILNQEIVSLREEIEDLQRMLHLKQSQHRVVVNTLYVRFEDEIPF